jgi:hypothetical protein
MRNSYVAIVRGVHATTKAIQPLHITSTFDHQRRGAKNDGIAEEKRRMRHPASSRCAESKKPNLDDDAETPNTCETLLSQKSPSVAPAGVR